MVYFFFFNDTATTEIYTLSLHDALPISAGAVPLGTPPQKPGEKALAPAVVVTTSLNDPFRSRSNRIRSSSLSDWSVARSEEHTSELQSRQYLVCRLLLEKKKNIQQLLQI